MNSISELNFDLNKQKILRIRAQNENREERRRLNDIDVLCRLLSDDNNNATDELSDFSTIESSRESSDCQQSGSAESLRALTLEESLLSAEVKELSAKSDDNCDDDDIDDELQEFTRIERELRLQELLKCVESVRQQIKTKALEKSSAPLAISESSLCSREESPPQDKRQLRPLTLYMPIEEEELDLCQHIQTLGHQMESLDQLIRITKFSCFGYLNKLCQNSDSNWRKRFFLFDRKLKQFVYFRSKRQFARNEPPKGGVAFEAIHDVYVDHERIRAHENRQVFVVGASHRQFVLSTARPEVMRIWVDVLVTGAQGYQHFALDF